MMTVREMEETRRMFCIRYQTIADHTGIPVSTVQKVLSGKTLSPKPRTMEVLRQFFSVFEDTTLHCEYPQKDGNTVSDASVVRETPGVYTGTEKLEYDPVIYDEWPHKKLTDLRYTIADYYALPKDVHAELINGELIRMDAPKRIHQKLLMFLAASFYNFIRENDGSCEVYPATFDVQLDQDDYTMVQPDVVVICDQEKLTDNGVYGAPDLCVEILSRSSRNKDMVLKLQKYMEAGVREYWIVDPELRRILVYMEEKEALCEIYSFEDPIPVGIWDGRLALRLADAGV